MLHERRHAKTNGKVGGESPVDMKSAARSWNGFQPRGRRDHCVTPKEKGEGLG